MVAPSSEHCHSTARVPRQAKRSTNILLTFVRSCTGWWNSPSALLWRDSAVETLTELRRNPSQLSSFVAGLTNSAPDVANALRAFAADAQSQQPLPLSWHEVYVRALKLPNGPDKDRALTKVSKGASSRSRVAQLLLVDF